MNGSLFETLFSILRLVSPILIFIGSIYFLIKHKGVEAILLTVGSGLTLLMSIFYMVLAYLASRNIIPFSSLTTTYTAADIFGFISYLIFAIGFFMLLLKLANPAKQVRPPFPPNNY